jgi:hypothetical protein
LEEKPAKKPTEVDQLSADNLEVLRTQYAGKNKNQFHFVLSDTDKQTLVDIAEYWGTSQINAFRTMLRYFEVNLGLRRSP